MTTNLIDLSRASEAVRPHELVIVGVYCALALAACLVLAVYADPANYAPLDPAAVGFFP